MERLEEILEFNKIKEMMLKYNINALSRSKVEELQPYYFDEVIQEQLDQTNEAFKLVSIGTFPSLGSLIDMVPYLDSVHKNATLSLEEIYEFVNCLEVVESIREFLLKSKIDEGNFKYTFKYIKMLNTIPELYDSIHYCVSPNFTLYDHASSKLKQIRMSIKKCELEIKEKLNSFLRNNASLLSDNFIATRGTHLVLPVKAANKNQVKGIVVDVSDSKNTVFIEPYSVTENNIMLEQLHYEEEMEIQRIIKALCEIINKYYQPLMQNNEALKELSFMILKGVYGQNNNYEIASLNENNEIELIGAKHPLIDPSKVIENDFYLGGKYNRVIVISGPNAGGKTVALKTIALLVLMNQCGLPLPVKSASLPVFRNIYVDIGDEQSIEQSLSGFSSHMKHVSYITNNLNEHSLVILDELGSRTDPQEGEALAKAIIEYIENSNAIAMITTHYLGIKDYAKENSQITLASMGFDEDTLNPTYKLLINVVGRSYALEISKRLGLKDEIIASAKKYKSSKSNDLDAIIDELSKKLKQEEIILQEMKEKEAKLNADVLSFENEKEKYQKNINKMMDDATRQKEEMIEVAYKEIQQIVNEFKASNESNGFKHHLKNQALDKLENLADKEEDSKELKDILKEGDNVRIIGLNKMGVIKSIKGNKATIQSANNTMVVPLVELEAVSNKEIKREKRRIRIASNEQVSRSVPMSCNLIGMHVEEALIQLRNYLDAALMVHYSQVTIIHGYGTGALRKAVHEFLRGCKFVEEFTLGGLNEGGSGATVVKLKVKK